MSTFKIYLTEFLKYVCVFGVLILSFNILLYLTCSFPSEAIYDNVFSSAETLVEEGGIFKIGLMEKVDNHTEALIINEAYSVDSNNPLESYMYVRKNYKKGITKKFLSDLKGNLFSFSNNEYDANGIPVPDTEYATAKELQEFLNGNVTTSVNYTRYYHGYLTLFRPLLLLFDISGIRTLLFFVFLLLLIYFCYLVKQKLNTKTMLVLLYSFLVYGYFFVSYTLQQAPSFLVLMISSIWLLKGIEKYNPGKLYMHLFVTGCVVNYFDFLTTPVLTLTLPLLLYILFNKNNNSNFPINLKEQLKFIIFSGIIWSLGYALTWISKWILFGIIYNNTGFTSAISQIQHRSFGDISFVLENLSNSLSVFITSYFMYLILFLILLILVKNAKFSNFKLKNLKHDLPIIFVGLIPLAWQIILFNHSILHVIFTYRNMIIPLVASLLCILNHTEFINSKEETFIKR